MIGKGGCIDTSACYAVTKVGLGREGFNSNLKVYPNPADNQLQIDLGASYQHVNIRLTNTLGQVLVNEQYAQLRETELELTGASGLYFLEVRAAGGNDVILKVVKR